MTQVDFDVAVTWVNQTWDVRLLIVQTPDTGRMVIGSFTRGGSLSMAIRVRCDPAIIYWRAGNQSGAFVVGPDTPSYLRIDLTRSGPVGP